MDKTFKTEHTLIVPLEMKMFFGKLLVIVCASLNLSQTSAMVSIKTFAQRVDHWNTTDETFEQRYFENRVVYEDGGPIILFVGGNEAAEPQFILGGPLLEVAIEHKAILIYLEHRFFGKSIPFEGNLALEHLKYLTVENALEDITYFIKYLNTSIPEYKGAKVILAGSSYSGALVMWHRSKFPSMSKGVWSSSATILSRPDVPEYKKGVSAILSNTNHECNSKIHAGIEEMLYELTWLNTSKRIENKFNLCRPIDIDNKNDVMHFFRVVTTILDAVKHEDTAEILCRTFLSVEDNIMALALAVYSQVGSVDCLDASYNSALKTYLDEFDTTNQRAELYLACNQVGWFRSGASRLQPFGYLPTFDYFVDLCRNTFDQSITAKRLQENSDKLNAKYGGLTPFARSVFATYGEADPEISLGPAKLPNLSFKVQSISNAQHSYDFYWWLYARTHDIDFVISYGKQEIANYLKA